MSNELKGLKMKFAVGQRVEYRPLNRYEDYIRGRVANIYRAYGQQYVDVHDEISGTLQLMVNVQNCVGIPHICG